MKINPGNFIGEKYVKRVSFSKAVLWKDKQISLNPQTVAVIKNRGIKSIVFEDHDKNQRWMMSTTTFLNNAQSKRVGQETQYYIGIGLFEKTEIVPKVPVPVGEAPKPLPATKTLFT